MAELDLTKPHRLLRRSHFWQVQLRDTVVVTRHGKGIGLSGGRETVREFPDSQQASQWAMEAYTAKMADGYLLPHEFHSLRDAEAGDASQTQHDDTADTEKDPKKAKPPERPQRSHTVDKLEGLSQPTQMKPTKQPEQSDTTKKVGETNYAGRTDQTKSLMQGEQQKSTEQPKPVDQSTPIVGSKPNQPLTQNATSQPSAHPKSKEQPKLNENSVCGQLNPSDQSKRDERLKHSGPSKQNGQPSYSGQHVLHKSHEHVKKNLSKSGQLKPLTLSESTEQLETSKDAAQPDKPQPKYALDQNEEPNSKHKVSHSQPTHIKGSEQLEPTHASVRTPIRRSGRKRSVPAPYIAESASRSRPRKRISDSALLANKSSPLPRTTYTSVDQNDQIKVSEQHDVIGIDSTETPPSPMPFPRSNSQTKIRKRGSKRGGRSRSRNVVKSPAVKRQKRAARSVPLLPENVSLGIVDQSSGVENGVIYTEESNTGETVVFDVLLVYIDKHTHTDKFIVLQLIHDPSSESPYVLFEKMGRTGSAGQSLRIDFATNGLHEAREEFVRRFKDYTGLSWTNRHATHVSGKYRFAKQDYEVKFRVGFLTDPHWQYWVDEGDDKKSKKWLDYNEEDSMLAEELQMEFSSNPWLAERIVQNGLHFDLVNLESMTTTEVGHPNSSVHHFRRATDGDISKSKLSNNEIQPGTVVAAKQAKSIKSAKGNTIVKRKETPVLPQSSQQASVTQSHTPITAAVAPNTTTTGSELPGFSKVPGIGSVPMSLFTIPQMAQNSVMSQALMQSASMVPQTTAQNLPVNPLMHGIPSVSAPVRLGSSPTPASRYLVQSHAHNGSVATGIHPSLTPGDMVGSLPSSLLQLNTHTKLTRTTEPLLMSLAMQQQRSSYLQSALPPPTRALIDLLFDSEMHRRSLKGFGIDLRILPFNHLTATHIQQGVTVLEQIEAALTKGTNMARAELERLSTKFYTVLPHHFETRRPPVILSMELLQICYDMCIVLYHMVQALSILATAKTKIGSITGQNCSPRLSDQLYSLLSVDMHVVLPGSEEHLIISEAFHQTKGAYATSELLNIWRVERQGDVERFSRLNLVNHALLWTGCHIASVPSILTNGLQILSHSGGRLGKGIYCASESGKSLQSTIPDSQTQIGCMVLVEAALGRSYEVFEEQKFLLAPPHGYNSLRACGRQAPAGYKNVRLDNVQVSIAVMGAQPQMNAARSSFSQDEFVVYDEAQVRLRYLVTVKK
eukprot:TRINITY_DN310_c0_g1_i1.p1 TRINITY_DN310_c0_g1~~TRINITY_DN310_c0_g1_i1.p1  ORF type:complete len:1239 (-),score=162.41 TRINITY_DN310_c0_g1_i1:252-3968(-)